MAALLRSFLAFLMVVTLLGASSVGASAGLAAEIAALSEPCCDADCPEDPACGAACDLMLRGAVPLLAVPQAADHLVLAPETGASLLMLEQPPPSGLPAEGLKRPPRI